MKLVEKESSLAWKYAEIAQLYLKLDQPENAWNTVKEVIEKLPNSNKTQLGDLCIDIVNKSGQTDGFIRETYQFGMTHLTRPQTIYSYQKRFLAAEKMGDTKAQIHYKHLYQKEKAEIEAFKKRMRE